MDRSRCCYLKWSDARRMLRRCECGRSGGGRIRLLKAVPPWHAAMFRKLLPGRRAALLLCIIFIFVGRGLTTGQRALEIIFHAFQLGSAHFSLRNANRMSIHSIHLPTHFHFLRIRVEEPIALKQLDWLGLDLRNASIRYSQNQAPSVT